MAASVARQPAGERLQLRRVTQGTAMAEADEGRFERRQPAHRLPIPRRVRSEERVWLVQAGEPQRDLGELGTRRRVTLTLPARCPVMLEATPAGIDRNTDGADATDYPDTTARARVQTESRARAPRLPAAVARQGTGGTPVPAPGAAARPSKKPRRLRRGVGHLLR